MAWASMRPCHAAQVIGMQIEIGRDHIASVAPDPSASEKRHRFVVNQRAVRLFIQIFEGLVDRGGPDLSGAATIHGRIVVSDGGSLQFSI